MDYYIEYDLAVFGVFFCGLFLIAYIEKRKGKKNER